MCATVMRVNGNQFGPIIARSELCVSLSLCPSKQTPVIGTVGLLHRKACGVTHTTTFEIIWVHFSGAVFADKYTSLTFRLCDIFIYPLLIYIRERGPAGPIRHHSRELMIYNSFICV